MKLLKVLGMSLLIAVLVGGCNGPAGQDVDLTLFHTNDIHSHLRGQKSDPFGLGGIARLSTLLKQLRTTTTTSVTVDAGDWSEGTMYYSVDTGANMLRFLKTMGYDAVALGNHDFLSGPKHVADTVKAANVDMPVLAANLDMSNYSDAASLSAAVSPTFIKTVNGIRIGFIGLTTFEFLYDSYMAPVKITNPIDVATALAKKMRPDVDVIILISHNSYESNLEFASAIPGIDAIISGHSHRKVPRAGLVPNAGKDVPVVETNEWAKFLGELKLTVNVTTHTVRFKDYQLHAVSSDIAEDPSIAALVDAEDQKLNALYKTNVLKNIADNDFEVNRYSSGESPLGNLVVKAMRAATHTELAIDEISFSGVSMPKGPVSQMDLHDVSPHIYDVDTQKEWTLKVWNARGADLWILMNVLYSVTSLVPTSPIGWLSIDGAQVIWDPKGKTPLNLSSLHTESGLPSSPVKAINISGAPLDMNRRYKVAIHDAMVRAIGIANDKFHLGIDLSQLQDTGIEVSRAVIDYATRTGHLTLPDLRVGGHVQTEGPDVGLFDYAMDWDGHHLNIEVDNLGLADAADVAVECFSGLPNDKIAYGTELQVWTSFGQASVAAISAGAAAVVNIPFTPVGPLGTMIPVKCTATTAKDTYVANNIAQKVFKKVSN